MAAPIDPKDRAVDVGPLPSPEFAIEEYKQVLEERRMVMTRYIQAVGFYLALSGFGLRELITTSSKPVVLGASIVFSALNILAIYAARMFRGMAESSVQREKFFAQNYRVQQTHELFWGYSASLWLVALNELTIISLAIWKFFSDSTPYAGL
jgi:hypothetical protein